MEKAYCAQVLNWKKPLWVRQMVSFKVLPGEKKRETSRIPHPFHLALYSLSFKLSCFNSTTVTQPTLIYFDHLLYFYTPSVSSRSHVACVLKVHILLFVALDCSQAGSLIMGIFREYWNYTRTLAKVGCRFLLKGLTAPCRKQSSESYWSSKECDRLFHSAPPPYRVDLH